MFYINIQGGSNCFAREIKKICDIRKYQFSPNNKKLYKVDTVNKLCVGVDVIQQGAVVYNSATSYKVLKSKFV